MSLLFFHDFNIYIYIYIIRLSLDPMSRKRRRKHGGNKGKCFTEGWLEFKDKSIAKAVALSLNNTIIG